jgi:hypothetical protein
MFDPQQALLDLLQPGSTNQTLFPPTSRYHGIPAATHVNADGTMDSYRSRVLQQHVVTQGERLDHIAFRYLGDPEQFWRVTDANTEMNPDHLTVPIGRRIDIPIEGSL